MIHKIKFTLLIMVLIISITFSACGNSSETDSGWSQWEEVDQITEEDTERYDKIISSLCGDFDCSVVNSHIESGQYICTLHNKNSNVYSEVVLSKCFNAGNSKTSDNSKSICNSVFICLRNGISDVPDTITSFESFYGIVVELVNELTDIKLANSDIEEFIADESNIVSDDLEEGVVKVKYTENDGITMEYYITKCENDTNAACFEESEFIEEMIVSTF